MSDDNDQDELSPPEYLRDLADRILQIPVMHGTDQGDCDRLQEIASTLESSAFWRPASIPWPAYEFLWVRCENGEIELAYSDFERFQEARTAGDREGLSVEYIAGVTHWAELIEPVFKPSEAS